MLKSDNEFNATYIHRIPDPEAQSARAALQALLDQYRVFALLSPCYFPRYNGSIEAGIGAFKTRAHLEAARHGHPLEWNCDDVESARLQANEESRPWGFQQDSPDAAWNLRDKLQPLEQAAFRQSVELYEQELRQEKQQDLLEGLPLGPRDLAYVRRAALCRALVKHGFLSFRRQRITLPFNRQIA